MYPGVVPPRRLVLPVVVVAVLSGTARAAPTYTLAWESGFEAGFPGEWLDYDNGSFTESGVPAAGRQDAWTIAGAGNVPPPFEGDHLYRGWIFGANPPGENHRAYPAIHVDIATPIVNTFMVWLDADYDQLSATDWIHFATWGNNPDWAVHTMSVRDRRLEMAHLSWSWIGPEPRPEFPLRQWVRFTAYIHYAGAEGTVRVWQDGVPVIEGTYTARSGTNLMRAHWGMYANPEVAQGTQYNDAIRIWQLSEPLTDLTTEPQPPGAAPPDAGATPPPPPDAAPAADPDAAPSADDASGGCGCRAAGGATGPLPAAACVLVALFALRRTRDGVH